MEKKTFEIVMQTISAGLVEMIVSDKGLNEDTAMEMLSSSCCTPLANNTSSQ